MLASPIARQILFERGGELLAQDAIAPIWVQRVSQRR
jgi:hypothetical protein